MKCVRSILAVCMALLILGVTTGFSMGQHFCQGELLEVTLFGKAKPCEMEMSRSELPPCHSAEHGDESADTFSDKPCCEDHHAAVEIGRASCRERVCQYV